MTEAELLHDPEHTCFRPHIADGKVHEEWRVVDGMLRKHMYLVRDPYVGPGDEDMFCIYCGCTEHNACPGGCAWVVPYVCSGCVDLFYGTEEITQQYLCRVPDYKKIDNVETDVRHMDGDWAIELRGESVHLIRIFVKEAVRA